MRNTFALFFYIISPTLNTYSPTPIKSMNSSRNKLHWLTAQLVTIPLGVSLHLIGTSFQLHILDNIRSLGDFLILTILTAAILIGVTTFVNFLFHSRKTCINILRFQTMMNFNRFHIFMYKKSRESHLHIVTMTTVFPLNSSEDSSYYNQ